jgi:hypothetical protein
MDLDSNPPSNGGGSSIQSEPSRGPSITHTLNEREPIGGVDRHNPLQSHGMDCQYTGRFTSHGRPIQNQMDTLGGLSVRAGR